MSINGNTVANTGGNCLMEVNSPDLVGCLAGVFCENHWIQWKPLGYRTLCNYIILDNFINCSNIYNSSPTGNSDATYMYWRWKGRLFGKFNGIVNKPLNLVGEVSSYDKSAFPNEDFYNG